LTLAVQLVVSHIERQRQEALARAMETLEAQCQHHKRVFGAVGGAAARCRQKKPLAMLQRLYEQAADTEKQALQALGDTCPRSDVVGSGTDPDLDALRRAVRTEQRLRDHQAQCARVAAGLRTRLDAARRAEEAKVRQEAAAADAHALHRQAKAALRRMRQLHVRSQTGSAPSLTSVRRILQHVPGLSEVRDALVRHFEDFTRHCQDRHRACQLLKHARTYQAVVRDNTRALTLLGVHGLVQDTLVAKLVQDNAVEAQWIAEWLRKLGLLHETCLSRS
jgi:hypothetical protein